MMTVQELTDYPRKLSDIIKEFENIPDDYGKAQMLFLHKYLLLCNYCCNKGLTCLTTCKNHTSFIPNNDWRKIYPFIEVDKGDNL